MIHGLTTAAGIFFTTAVGVAAGLVRDGTAILCAALTLAVLTLTPRAQPWLEARLGIPPPSADSPPTDSIPKRTSKTKT